jgi:hypothetical protein
MDSPVSGEQRLFKRADVHFHLDSRSAVSIDFNLLICLLSYNQLPRSMQALNGQGAFRNDLKCRVNNYKYDGDQAGERFVFSRENFFTHDFPIYRLKPSLCS